MTVDLKERSAWWGRLALMLEEAADIMADKPLVRLVFRKAWVRAKFISDTIGGLSESETTSLVEDMTKLDEIAP